MNILRTLHVLGSGFDCASKAEIEEALLVGVPPQNIIYANPCKGKGSYNSLSQYKCYIVFASKIIKRT